jgi:hypothetical protein
MFGIKELRCIARALPCRSSRRYASNQILGDLKENSTHDHFNLRVGFSFDLEMRLHSFIATRAVSKRLIAN